VTAKVLEVPTITPALELLVIDSLSSRTTDTDVVPLLGTTVVEIVTDGDPVGGVRVSTNGPVGSSVSSAVPVALVVS
jgi:hypothetical protein